jgi:hypothetical protein
MKLWVVVLIVGFAAIGLGCGTTRVASRPITVTVTTPANVASSPTKTTTLPTLNQVLARKAKPAPTPVAVPSAGSDTTLTTYTDDGSVVELDDGSVWSVDDPSTVSGWSDGDPVTTTDAGDALVDTDTGDNTTATQIGSMTDQNSYFNTGDHSLRATGDDGSLVTLDDGSVWAINDAYDTPTVQGWTDSDAIVVRDNGDGTYTIVDTDDQSSVTANYVGGA